MVPQLELPSADPVVQAWLQSAQHAAMIPAAAITAAGAAETALLETELPPLSETEFAQVRLALSVSTEGPTPESIAENIPWIRTTRALSTSAY